MNPRWLALLAIVLFGFSSWIAYRQYRRPYQWHRAYMPFTYHWWSNPLDWNIDAGLPKITGDIKTAALSADNKRLWIAGDAGLLAYTDDQGRSWMLLNYDPASQEFRIPNAPPTVPHSAAEGLPSGSPKGPAQPQQAPPTAQHTLSSAAQSSPARSAASGQVQDIFNNTNISGVLNGPVASPRFSISSPYQLKELVTYHWNNGQGARPGTIALRDNFTGKIYGPFPAQGAAGQGGTPNVNWVATVKTSIILPPGSYSVEDSDPSTWSKNVQSQDLGFAIVRVTPAPIETAPLVQAPNIVAMEIPNFWTSADDQYLTEDNGLTWSSTGFQSVSPSGIQIVIGKKWFTLVNDEITGTPQTIYKGGYVTSADLTFESVPGSNPSGPIVDTIQKLDTTTKRWNPVPGWDASPVTAMWLSTPKAAAPRLWVVSQDGDSQSKVSFTDDAGKTFQPNSTWPGFSLESLVFDEQGKQGWLVGDNGIILHTNDQGASWDPVTRSAGAKEDQGESYSRMLAPWYWLVLALCAVLILPSFAPRDDRDPNAHVILIPPPGMKVVPHAETATARFEVGNQVVSDRPLEPGEPDALGLGAIAAGIAFFLRNDKTKPPLAIGISGRWGSGKSSLMNLLKKNLESYGSRPVWFNAWHHQKEEQLLAALLQAIKIQAVPSLPAGLGFRLRLAWIRLQRHWFRLALAAALVFLVYRLEVFLHQQQGVVSLLNSLLAGRLTDGLLSLLPQNLLTIVTVTVTLLKTSSAGLTAFGTDPASLLTTISKGTKVKDLAAQTSFRERFAQEFAEVTRALGSKRMLILIDDLDRCRPEKVREVLEAVNFLVSSGDCFIVLGMARDMVEHCVGLSFREVVDTLTWESMGLSQPEIERVITETERAVAKGSAPEPATAGSRAATEILAKRHAFARLYLDKLIQIEVAVPEPTAAQKRLLFQASGEPGRQESKGELRIGAWLRSSRVFGKVAAPIVGAAAMSVILAGIGLLGGHYARSVGSRLMVAGTSSSTAPAGAPPVTRKTSSPALGAPASPTPYPSAIPKPSGNPSPKPQIDAGLSLLSPSWLPFLPLYLALFGAASAAVSLLGQMPARKVTDTQPFVNALKVWHPLVMSSGARNTPRTARRFQNRIRYLAMRQRAQILGTPRSLGERCLRRIFRAPVQPPDPPVQLPEREELSSGLEKEISQLRNLLRNGQSGATKYWRVEQKVSGTLVSALDDAPFPASNALALAEGNIFMPEPLLVALAAINEYDPIYIEDENTFRKLIATRSTAETLGPDFETAISEHRNTWDNWYNMIYYRSAYLRLNSDANCHKPTDEKHFSTAAG